jgi:hypothetical protein
MKKKMKRTNSPLKLSKFIGYDIDLQNFLPFLHTGKISQKKNKKINTTCKLLNRMYSHIYSIRCVAHVCWELQVLTREIRVLRENEVTSWVGRVTIANSLCFPKLTYKFKTIIFKFPEILVKICIVYFKIFTNRKIPFEIIK